MEKVTIELGGKIITLIFNEFDTDINMDDITSIHYENIYGEMVTVSTLLNKIGLLQADLEHAVKEHDLELSIYKASLYEQYRKKLTRKENYVRKDGIKIIEPGNTEIENAVLKDEGYQLKYKNNLRIHRDLAYINSLYWSVKSKDNKLNALLKGVTPEEFQSGISEGIINTIMLKKRKSVLPSEPKI